MALEILSGDVVIAKQVDDTWIESTGTGLELPADLFLNYSEGRVNIGQVSRWLKRRVFPKERTDADKLLEELGLKEYDPMKIVKITEARMFQDSFWVRWTDEDVSKRCNKDE